MKHIHIPTLFLSFILGSFVVFAPAMTQAAPPAANVRGKILLQVQGHGEAWYVNPKDGKKYYIDAANGRDTLLSLATRVNEPVFWRLALSWRARNLRAGQLVIRSTNNRLYYVCPGTRAFMAIDNGVHMGKVLMSCVVGASDSVLAQIPTGKDIPTGGVSPADTPVPQPEPIPAPAPVPKSTNAPVVDGCQIYPTNNAWNQDVSKFPLHAKSATYIAAITQNGSRLHPDFGTDLTYGIPYSVVGAGQAKVPITLTDYADESDPGPYPVPSNAKVEQGDDGHVIVLDSAACKLYELYQAKKMGSGWEATAGAVFDLSTNALRPQGWTSADAAGLPIFPGLVRYDEVASGAINHAIRFTAHRTSNGWIAPATHQAGLWNDDMPPMGLRVRLKADYDVSKLGPQARIIAEAMKKYGMILADNGGSWFFSGTSDSRWNQNELEQLKSIPGSAFEAVDTGPIIKN